MKKKNCRPPTQRLDITSKVHLPIFAAPSAKKADILVAPDLEAALRTKVGAQPWRDRGKAVGLETVQGPQWSMTTLVKAWTGASNISFGRSDMRWETCSLALTLQSWQELVTFLARS